MRLRLKSALERALASRSISRFTRRRLNGQRLILAYHGVIPDGAEEAGERTLFITQRDFRAHLDMLATFNYATVLLGEAVRERQLLP